MIRFKRESTGIRIVCSIVAESYLHSLDPYLFQFGGGFGIRWYGLAYVAGFLIAWWMTWSLARSRRCLLDPPQAGDMMIYIILGVLLGGRRGYALFYDPHLFIGFTGAFPFWTCLRSTRVEWPATAGCSG